MTVPASVSTPAFAELGVASNFSFLRGASHGSELVARAAELGLTGMGIADRNTMAGVVRAHVAAKEADLRLVIGARLVTIDGLELLAWPSDRAAYGRLCSLLTIGNRRAPKGACYLTVADIVVHAEGIWAAVVPGENFSMLQHAPPHPSLPLKGGGPEKRRGGGFGKGQRLSPSPLEGEGGVGGGLARR